MAPRLDLEGCCDLTSAKSIALRQRFLSLTRKLVSCLTGMVLVAILMRSEHVYEIHFRLLITASMPLPKV